MCCFSGEVETVGDTRIFAGPDRRAADRQVLVYEMSYVAAHELAMVLPLPVPPRSAEDAVAFIDLSGYPAFFADLDFGFSPPRSDDDEALLSGGGDEVELRPRLEVHDVGDFEASFVPTIADFDRLEPRFRILPRAWERLPAYADYGFAVFKLNAAAQGRRVHPMAFSFPRRDRDTNFFPTVHIHDGVVHGAAAFDHSLYMQRGGEEPGDIKIEEEPYVMGWKPSYGRVGGFMDPAHLDERLLDPAQKCFRLTVRGRFENRDIVIGKDGSFPEPLPDRQQRRARVAGFRPDVFAQFQQWQEAARTVGAAWMVVARGIHVACGTEAEVAAALLQHRYAHAYRVAETLEEQGEGLSRYHWMAGDRR